MILAVFSLLYLAVAIAIGYGLSVFLRSSEAEELMEVVRAGGLEGRMAIYLCFCALCWPATVAWLASRPEIREVAINAYREAKAANKADEKPAGRIDAEFEEGP